MASGLFYLYQMDESISQQELSSDNIARLDELKGGCNVKSVDLLFRSWMCKVLLNQTLALYHAKYEPAPSSGLAIIALEKLQHIT